MPVVDKVRVREQYTPEGVTRESFSIAIAAGKIKTFLAAIGIAPSMLRVGQGNIHNTPGYNYNHTNAADLGIDPNSPTGTKIREWLQAHNIPYLAFDRAIPGVSTAPHIHIGFPSKKGASAPVGTVRQPQDDDIKIISRASEQSQDDVVIRDDQVIVFAGEMGNTPARVAGNVPDGLQKFIILGVGLVLIIVAVSQMKSPA